MDANITSCDSTRPYREGGRDAAGIYRIGLGTTCTDVEFSLEAKCYKFESGYGVNDTARLIAKLKHRQFGNFVTSSYVSLQASKEAPKDRYAVLILVATDFAQILISKGLVDSTDLLNWLGQF